MRARLTVVVLVEDFTPIRAGDCNRSKRAIASMSSAAPFPPWWLVKVVQARKKINAAVVGGMTYPLAILGLVLTYIYLFGAKVIPQFALMMDPGEWHGAARSLYLMSLWVQQWMGYAMLSLGLVLLLWLSLPRWRGDMRNWVDRLPPYSIYRLMMGTSFLMAFSALQSAGVPVERALMRLAHHAPPWLRERLEGCTPALACWEDVASWYGVNVHLLYAIAKTESSFNPNAMNRNKNGSYDVGLMQINSSWLPTLRKHGVSEAHLKDPCINLQVGAWILSHNMARMGVTWEAVGAYNARDPKLRMKYAQKVYKNLPPQVLPR